MHNMMNWGLDNTSRSASRNKKNIYIQLKVDTKIAIFYSLYSGNIFKEDIPIKLKPIRFKPSFRFIDNVLFLPN